MGQSPPGVLAKHPCPRLPREPPCRGVLGRRPTSREPRSPPAGRTHREPGRVLPLCVRPPLASHPHPFLWQGPGPSPVRGLSAGAGDPGGTGPRGLPRPPSLPQASLRHKHVSLKGNPTTIRGHLVGIDLAATDAPERLGPHRPSACYSGLSRPPAPRPPPAGLHPPRARTSP